jgi:hypothetical protein
MDKNEMQLPLSDKFMLDRWFNFEPYINLSFRKIVQDILGNL